MILNPLRIPVQCFPNIDADARQVNVQLVLRTAGNRVNCHAEVIPRERCVQRLVHKSTGFPGAGEVVRRLCVTNDRALDAGNSSDRNEQELTIPSRVPKNCKSTFRSPIQVNFQAGRGVMIFRLPGNAHVMHDFPQSVSREACLSRTCSEENTSGASTNRRFHQ